ncbi:hypothetical protein [Aquitalea pelogenes]|uniref:hypothetical protein n=1 Tax=Aquitalea pelogenes TaxID=1293573 RepID=UPI0035B4C3EB
MKPNFTSNRSKFQFWLLLLTVYAVFVPLMPGMPSGGLDESWQLGVNEALAKGMVFGRDLIFTFGPYASVYANKYHPAVAHSMLWSGFFLGSCFFLAAILNFASLSLRMTLFLVLVLAVNFAFDPRFLVYPLLVFAALTRLDWSLLRMPGQYLGRLLLVSALFAPFGMIVLVKGSFLVTCLCGMVLSSAFLFRRKQWLLAALVVILPFAAMAGFWWLAGQPMDALPDYFRSMLPIISGYTEAMAYNSRVSELLLYLLAAILLLVVAARELELHFFDKMLFLACLFVTLFITFKAGFVRHDGHAVIAASSLAICAVLVCSRVDSRNARSVLALSFIVWLGVCALHNKPLPKQALQAVASTYGNLFKGSYYRLFEPDAITQRYKVRMTEIAKEGKFPLLHGSSDVYSYDQAFLIATGNDWRPRPIFQSYSVYTDTLSQINLQHLSSSRAPANIFFKVQPIDERLPSLEDGASWMALWQGYHPVRLFNDYLQLARNTQPPIMQLSAAGLEKRTAHLGEAISVPQNGSLVMMRVHVQKNMPGNLVSLLFKPGLLSARLKLVNGQVRSFHVVSGMMSSGFVVSPLIETTNQFNLVYSQDASLVNQKVSSITILSDSKIMLWQPVITVEFIPYFIRHV